MSLLLRVGSPSGQPSGCPRGATLAPGRTRAVAASNGKRKNSPVRSDLVREAHAMSTAPAAIRNFARRLVALEVPRDELPAAGGPGAVRVCEKLRVPLIRLVGVAGFRSLMSRAAAVAKAEVPALAAVEVHADGTLAGLDGLQHDPDDGAGGEAGIIIVAQLLNLLVTFIGEPLTLHLVRDAWPGASFPAMDAEGGEES